MALQEHAMENTEENLKKLQQNMTLLNQQFESIQRNALLLDEVKEQVRAMQRLQLQFDKLLGDVVVEEGKCESTFGDA
ncbi:hypothetical protein FOCC_FOCC013125 [Frankliniella occidentalis]|nr:hypothetical protein FOCC_FOCC013125 [Frankliniella occidentalis]